VLLMKFIGPRVFDLTIQRFIKDIHFCVSFHFAYYCMVSLNITLKLEVQICI
jgi:hypothetical protein